MPAFHCCSGCITGLPHYCNSFARTTCPQHQQTSSLQPRLTDPGESRAINSPPTRLLYPIACDPPTPQPLAGLPWAPLSRRDPLHIRQYPLYALPHSTYDAIAAPQRLMGTPYNGITSKTNDIVVYTPPSPHANNIWLPAAMTPVPNYHFESEWREDARGLLSANDSRRMALPKLSTQFHGRSVRGTIPCVEATDRDHVLDSTQCITPVRRSVFREELESVAGSENEGDDKDSRHMGQASG